MQYSICIQEKKQYAYCTKTFPNAQVQTGISVQTHPHCAAALLPAAAEAAADGKAMVVDNMMAETEAANGAYNNQPKTSNSSRTAVKVTVTAAAMAEAHTTINQKAAAIAAAIAAETMVEAVAMAAAVAEAKTAAEGAAATLRRLLWQQRGQAMAGAVNNQPKSGRNGSRLSFESNLCYRSKC